MNLTTENLRKLVKEELEQYIEVSEDYRSQTAEVKASVVIVAYNTNWELIDCLKSLEEQSCSNFEIIVVDNGKNEAVHDKLSEFPILYILLNKTIEPSIARNVGIIHAEGNLVCFIDDDALAHQDYVEQHIRSHQIEGGLGVRGKVLPKSNSLYNCLAFHYDLGDEIIPSYIDTETNASFRRDVLIEVGGFNPQVFYGDGLDLSYRLVNSYGNSTDLIYYPDALVYHDYSTSLRKLIRKTIWGAKSYVLLKEQTPDIWKFAESYHPFPHGNIPRPRNFPDRVRVAILRRLQRQLKKWARIWFSWKRRSDRLA